MGSAAAVCWARPFERLRAVTEQRAGQCRKQLKMEPDGDRASPSEGSSGGNDDASGDAHEVDGRTVLRCVAARAVGRRRTAGPREPAAGGRARGRAERPRLCTLSDVFRGRRRLRNRQQAKESRARKRRLLDDLSLALAEMQCAARRACLVIGRPLPPRRSGEWGSLRAAAAAALGPARVGALAADVLARAPPVRSAPVTAAVRDSRPVGCVQAPAELDAASAPPRAVRNRGGAGEPRSGARARRALTQCVPLLRGP